MLMAFYGLPGEGRIRSNTEAGGLCVHLARFRSAHSLKNLDEPVSEDKLTLITQMFWIAVSMLESDYEYEFSLALRLLNKVSAARNLPCVDARWPNCVF